MRRRGVYKTRKGISSKFAANQPLIGGRLWLHVPFHLCNLLVSKSKHTLCIFLGTTIIKCCLHNISLYDAFQTTSSLQMHSAFWSTDLWPLSALSLFHTIGRPWIDWPLIDCNTTPTCFFRTAFPFQPSHTHEHSGVFVDSEPLGKQLIFSRFFNEEHTLLPIYQQNKHGCLLFIHLLPWIIQADLWVPSNTWCKLVQTVLMYWRALERIGRFDTVWLKIDWLISGTIVRQIIIIFLLCIIPIARPNYVITIAYKADKSKHKLIKWQNTLNTQWIPSTAGIRNLNPCSTPNTCFLTVCP